jgi:hypothetical protein
MRRLLAVTLLVCAACAGPPLPPEEPAPTARAKGRGDGPKARTGSEAVREAEDPDAVKRGGKQWAGWRYSGDRDDCYFVHRRSCYETKIAACKAAKCGHKRCVSDGAGPATVKCQ